MPNPLELDAEELRHWLEDSPAADRACDPQLQARVCLPSRWQTRCFVEDVDVVKAPIERLYRKWYDHGHLQHSTTAEINMMQDLMDPVTMLAESIVRHSHPSQACKWRNEIKKPVKRGALGCLVGHAPRSDLDQPKSRSGRRRPQDNAQGTQKQPRNHGMNAATLKQKSIMKLAAKHMRTVSARQAASKAATKQESLASASLTVSEVQKERSCGHSGKSGKSGWHKWRLSGAEEATKSGWQKWRLSGAEKAAKTSAVKDPQKLKEIEAKICLLPEAAPDEKTEKSLALLMDGFRKYLLGHGLKETSAKAYLTCFNSLFMRDFRSYEASAGEEYKTLIKESTQNRRYHAAVSHFRSFYQMRKTSAVKDPQKLKEIEAKICLLPEAAPDEKTEESFALLMDRFLKYLLMKALLKETSAKSFVSCFSLLFKRDLRSYEASAGEEYKTLIKESPQNKNGHGQYYAAVCHFRSFYQVMVNR
mmetsp:Transcript_138774/g.276747  ORF Transcript_138774/g.276747 Transcript_138774/m.276747 type:complete len:476 (+) Transcript_138774:141-1568(+)